MLIFLLVFFIIVLNKTLILIRVHLMGEKGCRKVPVWGVKCQSVDLCLQTFSVHMDFVHGRLLKSWSLCCYVPLKRRKHICLLFFLTGAGSYFINVSLTVRCISFQSLPTWWKSSDVSSCSRPRLLTATAMALLSGWMGCWFRHCNLETGS